MVRVVEGLVIELCGAGYRISKQPSAQECITLF